MSGFQDGWGLLRVSESELRSCGQEGQALRRHRVNGLQEARSLGLEYCRRMVSSCAHEPRRRCAVLHDAPNISGMLGVDRPQEL